MILLNDTSYFSGVGTLVAIPGQSQDLSAASGPRTPPSQSCRESPRGSLSLAWSWLPVTLLKCRVSAETSSAALTGALTTSCPLYHFNCLWHPVLSSQMCKAVCGFGDLAAENKLPISQASVMTWLHSMVIGMTEQSLRTHWHNGLIYLESFWISFSCSKYLL